MRTFTKIREMLATHKELKQKIEEMEKKYDEQFKAVFDAIRQLMAPPEPKKVKSDSIEIRRAESRLLFTDG